jgi:diguanylate cyclase (GGDEF)-like protein
VAIRSFQTKLLYLVIAVLLLLQAATLVSVHFAGQASLRSMVADELRLGRRVFDRLLGTRAAQASESVRVLASDFPFRQTVAEGDVDTVRSLLANHGERISADFVILVSLEGTITASTIDARSGVPFPYQALLGTARERGGAASTVTFAGRPHQIVIVPVLAPQPIAWVCAGFAIDESALADAERVTELEVSLETGSTAILPVDAQRADSARFASSVEPLQTGDNSRINVVLQRSLLEAGRPFVTLELQIFTFSTLALIAAVFAAVVFSRQVARPLQRLAEGAGRIERGDYVSDIVVSQKDEFGQLATAFNQMQSAIAAREEQIIHQATHDALTGLPNRTLFMDRLGQAIAGSKRSGDSVGMVMMDIDRFKEINDTLGHHVGDQLLIEIGRRLTQALRQSDTVARLGGDEFAVKFTARDTDHAADVARRIAMVFNAPVTLGDVAIDVNASLGIALYPAHAEDAETLMKRADVAMYDAKKNQSGFALYEARRDEHSLRRLSLMMELRQAIARDELELHYQPKVDFATRRTVHAEALIRWNHPRHGRLRPDEFIPLAEQSGNIGMVTKWVLRRALKSCASWRDRGAEMTVAVNLSALDLFDAELPTYISGLLAETSLQPSNLVLEITESAVMKDPTNALKILRDLNQRGVALAIDDFGTGYSSLAHLKRMPVDELKIDKSFVLNLTSEATDDFVIVRSTIELGHNMGLRVVAEGVETAEAWEILKALKCDMAQGYFLSPPLPEQEFCEYVDCEGEAAALGR